MISPTARTRRAPRLLAVLCLGAALIGCESKINEENFAQIKAGMSLAQVENILGSGTEETSSGGYSISGGGVMSGSGAPKDRTYIWKDGSRQIIVTVADGKVVQVTRTGW